MNFLIQDKTGRIYQETPQLLIRHDMRPYNPAKARARIEALQRRLDILEEQKASKTYIPDISEESTEDARTIANLEEAIRVREKEIADAMIDEKIKDDTRKPISEKQPTIEELEEMKRKRVIDDDEEIQKIRALRNSTQVAEHILIEYGETISIKGKSLQEMKDIAEDFRVKRIFEGDKK